MWLVLRRLSPVPNTKSMALSSFWNCTISVTNVMITSADLATSAGSIDGQVLFGGLLSRLAALAKADLYVDAGVARGSECAWP